MPIDFKLEFIGILIISFPILSYYGSLFILEEKNWKKKYNFAKVYLFVLI